MVSGSTSLSSSRATRSIRVLVFPEPALAVTKAEMAGVGRGSLRVVGEDAHSSSSPLVDHSKTRARWS